MVAVRQSIFLFKKVTIRTVNTYFINSHPLKIVLEKKRPSYARKRKTHIFIPCTTKRNRMNDKTAFDKMFREWYAQLFYFAYQFLNDTEASRDIIHDSFEYLWRNYDKIDERTAKSYLYTVVKTRCIDYLRKASIHKDYVEYAAQAAERIADDNIADDRIAKIRTAMKKLTPYNLHILKECFIHKKKYKEVAEELNVSVAAIHKNIVKALRILRKELGQEGNKKKD